MDVLQLFLQIFVKILKILKLGCEIAQNKCQEWLDKVTAKMEAKKSGTIKPVEQVSEQNEEKPVENAQPVIEEQTVTSEQVVEEVQIEEKPIETVEETPIEKVSTDNDKLNVGVPVEEENKISE